MTLAMIAPAMTPTRMGFDVLLGDVVEFAELFAYVGDRMALICSAAPSCQTHWLTEKLPRS
jgi:hypothetical protein